MVSRIIVAVVSPICRVADVEANLTNVESWVRKAAEQEAEFVAFPELCLCGYAYDPALREVAEPVPGPTVQRLEHLCRDVGIYASVGMLETHEGDLFNAQVVIGPDGYMGLYRKHYPTSAEVEFLETKPGVEYPTFDVGGVRLGINICADSRHMDTIDALAERGVRLVHNPHANFTSLGRDAEEWTRGKLAYYLPRVLCVRAHILINNLAGTVSDTQGQSYDFSGGAMILDPLGQVVARTQGPDRDESMLVATLDTALEHHVPPFEISRLR